jgi:hypothetical protein
MRVQICLIAAIVCSCALGTPATAHHSTAATYDLTKPVVFKGRVKAFLWANPHAHILMDVEKPDGSTEEWALELASPNTLFRSDWRDTTVKPGDAITVTAFVPRPGVNRTPLATTPPNNVSSDLYSRVVDLAKNDRMAHTQEITLSSGRKLTYIDQWSRGPR